MASRMDKYRSNVNPIQSRSQKNEHLYEEFYSNKIFTEITDIGDNNVVEFDPSSDFSFNKRESFQRRKALYPENTITKSNSFLEKTTEIETKDDPTTKNYNINDILDDAKKNRTTRDELEKKRHLRTVEYNILSDLNQEKLKTYQENKQKLSKDEEDNLEELIHTITSNSLRKKIDDELLSDLLPTQESETLISNELLNQIENNHQNEETMENTDTMETGIDTSFYTKSMDLSEEDFDFEDEEDQSFLEESKSGILSKVFIILFVLLVLGIIGYVIYRFI